MSRWFLYRRNRDGRTGGPRWKEEAGHTVRKEVPRNFIQTDAGSCNGARSSASGIILHTYIQSPEISLVQSPRFRRVGESMLDTLQGALAAWRNHRTSLSLARSCTLRVKYHIFYYCPRYTLTIAIAICILRMLPFRYFVKLSESNTQFLSTWFAGRDYCIRHSNAQETFRENALLLSSIILFSWQNLNDIIFFPNNYLEILMFKSRTVIKQAVCKT